MIEIIELLKHTINDSINLIPFLFITYVIMEYIEHKTSDKLKNSIKKSGKYGPVIGALVGIFPQCGFSVSATNLYSARVITLGTLISVYLATSDEMLPILITEAIPITTIFTILLIKLIIGILSGIIIDFIIRTIKKKKVEEQKIEELCKHEHCHCEKGILKSAIKHTVHIFIYIFITTLIINCVIHLIGEENIFNFLENNTVLGPIITGLIGLIPNCASSVILTELYIENIISISMLISGVLVNAGVGILVLFKINKNLKQNIKIVTIMYIIGVISGLLLEIII